MNHVLAIFTRGRIIKAVDAADPIFLDRAREYMRQSKDILSPANGDEAWVLPSKEFSGVMQYLAGDTERQRKAIRAADGAMDAGQYFYTKDAGKYFYTNKEDFLWLKK